jgi:type I restriction enzyme, S subunit
MTRTIPLGEIVEIKGGGTPSRSKPEYWGGSIPWATVKDFRSTELSSTQETITDDGVLHSATNIIPVGAIVVPTRMALGKAAITSVELAINQDLKALLPRNGFYNRFLLHFILSKASFLEGKGKGATVKGITLDVLRSLEIPCLPEKEQRRIAAILDRADGIRRKCEQLQALADDFLQTSYAHLVGHNNPHFRNWKTYKIEELAAPHKGSMRTGPFGSDLRHGEFVDHGIAVLGIDNAVKNRFAWDERRYISEEKFEALQRYRVFPADIIVTIMGTTGHSAVVPNDIPEAITTKHLATITCDREKVVPEFLSFAIHSDPLVVRQIQRANKGAIMEGLNLGIIKSLEIKLPPHELQEKFAKILNQSLLMKQEISVPEKNGEALLASLSQCAFRGDL